jgi:uncharacterized SAM-dependent methyltransferase
VLAEWLPSPLEVVELGSGTGATTLDPARGARPPRARRLSARRHLAAALADCKRRVERIQCVDVGRSRAATATASRSSSQGRAPGSSLLVLFLGSSIGNLERDDVRRSWPTCAASCGPETRLLLGADLLKPEALLLAAYDDPLGLTAAFNRNALARVNRELDADFDPRAFEHRASTTRSRAASRCTS